MLKDHTDTQRNVISHVALRHEAESVWMDALADISKAIRLNIGQPTGFLKMGEEVAMEQPGGVLRLSTTIAGEKIEMDIPPGVWRHKGTSADRNAH